MAYFFDLFKARVKAATEAERTQRQLEIADLKFEAGEHWSPADLLARKIAEKPSLTIDILSGPIKQVTNQQRSARPGIKISPVGNGADIETAEHWQGVVRRVERLSQAQRAYCWAGQYQVKMGRGFWVVRNIQVGEDGQQDIRIKAIENQHSVLIDPGAKELDGSDKRWAIIFEDLTRADYIARFGESKLADAMTEGFSAGYGDTIPEWVGPEHARIAEYYQRIETKRTKLILSTGEKVFEDELPTVRQRVKGRFASVPQLPEGVTVLRRVPVTRVTIKWSLVNGIGEELETTTIPGELIPVVMVYGERRFIDGKRDFRGMVRMAQDPCRMEDYCESSLMEAISHAKTAPWLAEFDQIAAFEDMWKRANTAPPQVLFYKRTHVNGHPVPPPQRVSSGVDVSALTLAAQRMQNHVKNITGQVDVFQDESAREQASLSGRAMNIRRQSQELGTSDYLENLGDGIVLTAKIIMGMAREVYDTPQLLRIVGADEKESEVVAFAGADQRPAAQAIKPDVKAFLDVTAGDYDVTISAARSPITAREDAKAAMEALPPELLKVGADLYVGTIDAPGMQEFAKRLKKMNPAAQDEQEQALPPAVMQQMQQAQQVIDALTERVNAADQALADKDADRQSKERIEQAKIQSQFALEQLRFQHEQTLKAMELAAEIDKLKLSAMLAPPEPPTEPQGMAA